LSVYLNNAATSFPKVPGLGKEVAAFLEKTPKHPGRTGGGNEDVLNLCRSELADLIREEDPSDIVLCKNSTEALNIVIHGLELNGVTVVTTAMEHNSVLRPLYILQKKGKIKLEIVPCDKEGRVLARKWEKKIAEVSPKLVVLNHASNVTGAVNNAKQLLSYAKKHGCITILDASQSLGLIDINNKKLESDVIVFTGHKYLLGPTGTGGFYVNKKINIDPVFVGGTGVRSDLREMPPEMPFKLEAGTHILPMIAGLLHSLKWNKENPIHLSEMEILTNKLERGLLEKKVKVIKVNGERTFMVSFVIPEKNLNEVGFVLERGYDIICRTGLHCAPLIHQCIGTVPEGSIRFSISRFTTREEIDYTINAVGELMYETN